VPVLDTGVGPDGAPTRVMRTARRPCSCAGGTVSCGRCSGRGIVTCGSCEGSGRLKTFDQLVVRFQAATQGELLDTTPVPDGWLGGLSGDVLVDERAPRIEQVTPVTPDVDRKAAGLLAKAHQVDEDRARLLLQALRIDRIPLYEVKYKYAGVDRQLWICGTEKDVYAPHAPWHRQRFFWLIAGVVLAVALVVGLLLYFLWPR
jgi:hypothetical protein